MLERVLSILQQKCSIGSSKPILIGVSGGPDSVCLLTILLQLKFPLVVAHFSHGLRPQAGAEAAFVKQLAQRFALPFLYGQADTAAFAETESLSIEEAARILRYRFLFDEARVRELQAVAVAHTADDQVETVLMHFLRGSGLGGLKGMDYCMVPNEWSSSIPLVRPLLDVWRPEVETYLKENNLSAVEDLSNLDVTFSRNRLRHELIPALEGYNPGIRSAIFRTAQILKGDHQALEGLVDHVWDTVSLEQGDGYWVFSRRGLLAQPAGIQRRLIRRGMALLRPGLRDIDFSVVESALKFIQVQTRTRRRDLAAGLYLFLEGERLWLAAWEADLPQLLSWPQLDGCSPTPIPIPGRVVLSRGWSLEAEWILNQEDVFHRAQENSDPWQAWLDADDIPDRPFLRCRQSGDRFQPFGMDGRHVNLADFMINVKIPQRARSTWPLVSTPERILWVPGYRLAHTARLTPHSERILHMVFQPPEVV